MSKLGDLKSRWPVHDWLFLSLILMYLIPVWAFPYFPSQDGPAHVYNSNLILSFFNSNNDVLHRFLMVNPKLVPTWFGHFLLAGLMIFFPLLIAEKLLISLYIILFVTGARYALGAINPGSKFLSVLFFPFVYNYLLHKGFYAFSMSLAVGLWVVGYWLKHCGHLTLKNIVVLWFLTSILYFNHVVSLGMVCIVIANLILGRILFEIYGKRDSFKNGLKGLWGMFFKTTSRTFYAFLPSILLASIFVLSRDTISKPGPSITKRLYNLIHLMPVVSFSNREIWMVSFFSLFLAMLSAHFVIFKWEHRRFDWHDFLLMAVAFCLILYLFVPQTKMITSNGMAAGGFIHMRVSYYIYFALLLWLGAHQYSTGLKVTVQCIAVAISIGLILSNATEYAKINRVLKEYNSIAGQIEPNTTLLPLDSCGGAWTVSYRNRVKPFLHFSNYIAAERKVLSLRNYEAKAGCFPFVFRSTKNPYLHIGDLQCHRVPPPANFIDYEERTGGQIDYVSVWLGKKVHQEHENILSIYRQLNKGYDLVYKSPNGLVELYRRKNWKKKG